MMTKEFLIFSLMGVPLIASALSFFLGNKKHRSAAVITLVSSVWVCLSAIYLAYAMQPGEVIRASFPWINYASFSFDIGVHFDALSSLMSVVVGVVGLAVAVFSMRYMREDGAKTRYFGALCLFVFSMFGIILMDNLLTVFLFWEMVGFTSYLLIGHYSTQTASDASRKAFLVNKIGDIGFIIAIVWALYAYGTTDLVTLNKTVIDFPHSWAFAISGLLLAGVIAKSAQWPLHIWLPDAMAGPTPVSALIHSATMVAAGIFLLCRFELMFVPVMPVIMVFGVITALMAAVWAFGQSDIKKVLAYSTLSQLGFMAVAFGLGSSQTAMFHLVTHASFKALLFLGAGAIIDACHHQQDALKMGGLWKRMPVTFVLFLVATLALIGFPYTAGFFSKDAILALSLEHSSAMLVIMMVASALTALYMGRLIGMVFLGSARSNEAATAKEGTPTYIIPMAVLGLGALLLGYMGVYPEFLASFFEGGHGIAHFHEGENLLLLWGILVALASAAVAMFYANRREEPLQKALAGFYTDIKEGFYFDRLWSEFGSKLVAPFTQFISFCDEVLISGFMTRGSAALVSLTGLVAKASYRNIITYGLYWILLGVLLLILILNR